MSGHSKWSTIKRKKGAADAKRGRIFSKLNKEILLAAREGGGDPEANLRLRNAIAAAREANMPKDNIARAIAKGTGEGENGETFAEITYEGYGPGGVAILVDTVTENRNRTTAEVRHAFTKYGGNLGEAGCVAWMFDRKGQFIFEKDGLELETLEELAIENGADDIQDDDDTVSITCAMEDFNALLQAFTKAGFKAETAELAKLPQSTINLTGKHVETMLKLMDALEELDDVQSVWSNFDVADEDLEAEA